MNIQLKEWTQEDVISLAKIANDEAVSNQLRNLFPYPYSEKEAQFFIDFTQTIDAKQHYVRAIFVDGTLAGGCSLDVQGDVNCKSAEIGYWLGRKFWGKGIASEVVRQLCVEGFSRFDIVRLYAEIFETNIGSRKVLEKNDFVYEGRFHKSIYKHHSFMDSLLFARWQ